MTAKGIITQLKNIYIKSILCNKIISEIYEPYLSICFNVIYCMFKFVSKNKLQLSWVPCSFKHIQHNSNVTLSTVCYISGWIIGAGNKSPEKRKKARWRNVRLMEVRVIVFIISQTLSVRKGNRRKENWKVSVI